MLIELSSKYHISPFCDDISDVELGMIYDRLTLAHISLDELGSIFHHNSSELMTFCQKYSEESSKIDDKQEYNPSEPPEEMEDNNEEFVGYSQVFPLQSSIYYYIIQHNPESLLSFVKHERMPFAKKYEAKLMDIYARVGF